MLKPIQLDENTLILDTETTGLGSDAEICEISIIDGLGNVIFDSLVKPIKPIPDEAIKIHGITNEMVTAAPDFTDIYIDIIDLMANKNIIIYNKIYDIKILKQVEFMHRLPDMIKDIEKTTTCAMRYYSEFKNQAKWSKLTDACISMGIDITQFKAHRALGDCQMTLELIRCMNDPQYIKNIKKKENKMIAEKPQTNVSEVIFDIKFTPSIINFDENEFNNSINDVIEPVKDLGNDITKEVLTATLANLRKFQKQISDRRIAIVKDIKAPITEFEAKIKKGDAEIEQYISKYDANLKAILAKEKIAKAEEIEKMLPNIISNNKLDNGYAAKLTILDDYYLAKWTKDKILVDLVKRAEELFKQQDYIRVQEELKNTQIESRTRLIEQLNAEYNLKYTYANYPVEKYNDLEVRNLYLKAYNEYQDWEQSKQHGTWQIDDKQIPVVNSEGNNIGEVTKIYKDDSGNTIADAIFISVKPTDQFLKNDDNKQQLEEYISENLTPFRPITFPKNYEPEMIYQNLRLGASKQSKIIAAVAKLKAEGLYVEFI